MGDMKRMLACDMLEPRLLSSTQLWADVCENIHLHYRNLRLDFSAKEWATFMAATRQLGMAVEQIMEKNDWEEGNPGFLVQANYNKGLEPNSHYYPTRLTIEAQRDGTYHIHYRDLRLHLTPNEFDDFRRAFENVEKEMPNLKPFPYRDVTEPTLVKIPISDIMPYDDGHKPVFKMDKEHRMGVEACKELIKQGKHIRPILVDNEGRRLDGFKRYMAQYEMGIKEIECIVDPNGRRGGQDGFPFSDENDSEELKFSRVIHVTGKK